MDKKSNLDKNIIFIIASALLVTLNVLLGVVLVVQSTNGLKAMMDDRLLDISNTAAAMINGDDLATIQTEADTQTEKYQEMYNSLRVFQENIDLSNVYCVRQVEEKKFIFIIDPDEPESAAEFGEEIIYTPALYAASQGKATADKKAYSDEWGRTYSSFSPIFSGNKVVGIIGVDIDASYFDGQLTKLIIADVVICTASLAIGVIIVVLLTTRQRKNITTIFNQLNYLAADVKSLSDELSNVTHHQSPVVKYKKYGDIRAESIESLSRRISELQEALKDQIAFVHERAFIDVLTGAYNTAAFAQQREIVNSEIINGNADFALLIFDLNNLKQINDTYGHENGDEILMKTVKVISAVVTGPIYRIGGDEFVVILENPYGPTINLLFKEIDLKIEAANMDLVDKPELSIAKGYAIFDKNIDHSFKEVFKRADEKMYLDKAKYHKKPKNKK